MPERAADWKMLVRGGLLAVTVAGAEKGDIPTLLRLFHTATGKDAVTLREPGNYGGYARDLSHDGRFLIGIAVNQKQVEVRNVGGPGGGFNPPGGFPPGGRGGRGGGGAPGMPAGQGGIGIQHSYSLVAWDTATGKRVRTWECGSPLPEVAFAPDRPLMVIVENTKLVRGRGATMTASTKSTLGIWDFSGLLK